MNEAKKFVNYEKENIYPTKILELWNQPFYEQNKELIRLINANFVIRVNDIVDGKKKKTLVGGGQITKYMSEDDAIEQFEKCLRGGQEKYTWWNRKTLRIEFISK